MKSQQHRVPAHGFTLVELVVVVAMVAILAAIALPAYNEQVRTSRRAAAQAVLNEVAQCMERFNTANGTYVGGDARCSATDTDTYTFVINVPNRNTFNVVANAIGGQSSDRCGDLGLNQAGQKTHSAGTDCWR
ncbi:type IV pilin protein [Aquimonas voraii]|uniref:Type IV pilus assembly protein PilE n=1 Tax=Aquimonas voraii TaxID=265719 RepID=A0A1G6S153_9GAMM|nr:type IV pilin protein [Aquimonas voraii]SDD10652.1 type IV pilus assembly protein PilE [Aquimonas voraii]